MTQAAIKSAAEATARGRAKRTSKGKLVQAARNLMLAQGYPITSVDDIIKAAGVSKGSFYHHFNSKEDLALTAMHEFLADGAALMMDGPFRASLIPESARLPSSNMSKASPCGFGIMAACW